MYGLYFRGKANETMATSNIWSSATASNYLSSGNTDASLVISAADGTQLDVAEIMTELLDKVDILLDECANNNPAFNLERRMDQRRMLRKLSK